MEAEKLSFSCPACQGVLRVPFELAGVRGPCPNCQTEIVAPIPATQTPAILARAAPAAAAIPPFPTAPPPEQPVAQQHPPPPAPPEAHPQQQAPPQQQWQSAPAAPTPPQSAPAQLPQSEQQWPPLPQSETPVYEQTPLPPQPQATPQPGAPPAEPPIGLPIPQPEPAAPMPTQFDAPAPADNLTLPPTGAPLPGHQPEISPWQDPPPTHAGSALPPDLPPPAPPEGTIPQPRPDNEPPASPPEQPTALQVADTADGKRSKRKKKRSSSSPKNDSGRGLSPVVKLAIPLLLLVGIAAGAVKFWPQIQSKLGIGEKVEDTTSAQALGTPASGEPFKEDPSGFHYTDEPNTNIEAVTPEPETRFPPAAEPVDPEPDHGSIPKTADEPTPKALPAVGGEPDDSLEEKAKAALQKALQATSVEELAKLVLYPNRVRPLIEKHYAGKSPRVTPVDILYETSTKIEDSDFYNHTFFVSTKTQPLRFPVSLDETEDGVKLDWESFIEMHDDLLGKFLSNPKSEPQTFRAIVARSHYFDTDVPKLGSKDCFRISTPIPGHEGSAFVSKKTDVAKACEIFAWDRVCFPIVTLRWTTTGSSKPYLEIARVDKTSWRNKSDTPQ